MVNACIQVRFAKTDIRVMIETRISGKELEVFHRAQKWILRMGTEARPQTMGAG